MTRKVTLTIPDELGERIDRYRDKLNQSAIFAAAIEKEIEKLSVPEATGDLGEVIARLRRQRESIGQQSYERGFEVGQETARQHADYGELKGLGELAESTDWPRIEGYYRIPPEYREHAKESADASTGGGHFDQDRFYKGYADGMLAIWNAVRAQLDTPVTPNRSDLYAQSSYKPGFQPRIRLPLPRH